MTKKIHYSVFFWLFALNFLTAQIYHVKGYIIDQATGERLQGVLVVGSGQAVYSDSIGQFNLIASDSLMEIQIRMVGYKPLKFKTSMLNPILVQLEPESYLLNTTVISSSRFEKPLTESVVSISVIKPELPNRFSSNSTAQILDRVAGVQIIDGQANIRGGSGWSYGAGSRVLLLLDDLPALLPDAGFPNWDDLPLENLGQIEILKGASSALYGSAAMNGIIHFRTNFPGSDPFTSISLIPKVYFKPKSTKQWWGTDSTSQTPYEGIVNFVHRKKYQWADLSISGSFTTKTGFNKDYDSDNGRFHALLRRKIHDRLNITLGLNFNKGKSSSFFYWKDNGYFEGASGSSSSSTKLRFTIDPSINYETKRAYQHKLKTRFYHVFNGNDNNQDNKSENIYLEYHVGKLYESLGLHCLAGVLYTQSWTKAKLYSDTRFNHQNTALFGQFEKRFFDRGL